MYIKHPKSVILRHHQRWQNLYNRLQQTEENLNRLLKQLK